jgi:superfamily II DNA or RNA helicase
VVLPSDDPDLLRLRPLGGTDEDSVGVYLPLEGDEVRSATLAPPNVEYLGDTSAAGLLRDAARLGFRAAAGPLRSLGRVAFEPRPYQLVPLLMALRLEPVRLLIADDVGLGKSPEAALIARELMDRGEIQGFCVLCPPHLCEQWQRELRNKFHIEAVLVRPGSVARLERDLDLSRSIFDEYPFTVVSIDYIKSDRRRDDFVRACPDLVIIDEAHTVARPSSASGGQHQRHQLVAQLAAKRDRHLVLTTATPHSGDETAFASLIGLLDPELESAIETLDYGGGGPVRERLSRHFVQRRRGDVADFLGENTPFPRRESAERSYRLGNEYQRLMTSVLAYAKDVVAGAQGLSRFRQRVHWWAALALLRCVSSSPAAAAEALRTRAAGADERDLDPRAVDRLAAGLVLDLDAVDEATQDDSAPGVDTAPEGQGAERRRLLDLARQAQALRGRADPKLAELSRIVDGLLAEKFQPIVFCRYVHTAHYVADELRLRLGKDVEVRAVTGELPPEEREERVLELGGFERRLLVATDCLSEGVNLQEHFNAVVHYDLAWNPTRHEQREGRVDRFNQQSPVVRTVMLYGQDNQVDGTVLQVLLRKADTIRKRLGVTVPVPVDSDRVLEAIFESLFLRRAAAASQMELDLGLAEAEQQVADAWERAADREQRTRTIFAQYALNRADVNAELEATRNAIGDGRAVERFVREACARLGASVTPLGAGQPQVWELEVRHLPAAVLARGDLSLDASKPMRVVFDLPAPDGTEYISRTHPVVEAVAGYLLDLALEDPAASVAKRAGAMRTDAVRERTTILVIRVRHLIHEAPVPGVEHRPPLLAEEVTLTGYSGSAESPVWLATADVEHLVRDARPVANIVPQQAAAWLSGVRATLGTLGPHLDALAQRRAAAVLEAHNRVRRAAGLRIRGQRVEPHLPPDVLGIYVLVPPPIAPTNGGR